MRWLEHVLHVRDHRLPWQAILCAVGVGCKKSRDCQTKTWHQSMELLIIGLSHIDKYRICGRDLRDYHYQWLEILYYMAQNRLQWHMCSHSMSSSNFWGFFIPDNVFVYISLIGIFFSKSIFNAQSFLLPLTPMILLLFWDSIRQYLGVLLGYGNLTRLIFLQVLFLDWLTNCSY